MYTEVPVCSKPEKYLQESPDNGGQMGHHGRDRKWESGQRKIETEERGEPDWHTKDVGHVAANGI